MLPSTSQFHDLTKKLPILMENKAWEALIKEAKLLHFEALVRFDEDLVDYRIWFNILISQAYLELGNTSNKPQESFICFIEALRYALKAVGVGECYFKESNLLAAVACDALYQAHKAGLTILPNEFNDCKELGYIKSPSHYIGERLKTMASHHRQLTK